MNSAGYSEIEEPMRLRKKALSTYDVYSNIDERLFRRVALRFHELNTYGYVDSKWCLCIHLYEKNLRDA